VDRVENGISEPYGPGMRDAPIFVRYGVAEILKGTDEENGPSRGDGAGRVHQSFRAEAGI